MPVILIPLLMFALALLGTLNPILVTPSLAPAAAQVGQLAPLEVFYTRSGVVSISPNTGATRFTPYSRYPDMDRRRAQRT